jgi:hypothetical protein
MSVPRGELRIHLGLAIALAICVPAFCFEVARAIDGNELSWAYVFEWPLLAAYAIYMWHRLLAQERGGDARPCPVADPAADEAMARLNEYFEEVHRHDGPQADGPAS